MVENAINPYLITLHFLHHLESVVTRSVTLAHLMMNSSFVNVKICLCYLTAYDKSFLFRGAFTI